jgi:polyhydroxybutyrate depolymerase
MSNGGLMAYRLACDSADIITAIATVAAAMPESLMTSCQPTRHISVLMINGTNDPILPWNSHQIRSVTGAERGTRLSVPETFRAWTKINNIGGAIIQKPVPTTKYDSTWAWMTSAHGFDDTDVVLYTVYGGGHTWPGGSQYLPIHYIGKTNQTFNAAAIAWEFLISHRLTPLTSSSSEK